VLWNNAPITTALTDGARAIPPPRVDRAGNNQQEPQNQLERR
jgi:hypothetical protein